MTSKVDEPIIESLNLKNFWLLDNYKFLQEYFIVNQEKKPY